MARRRFKSNKKKRRSNPKNTKVYKTGMRNTAFIAGGLGIVFVAMFYKLPIIQTLVANTWTYEGQGT